MTKNVKKMTVEEYDRKQFAKKHPLLFISIRLPSYLYREVRWFFLKRWLARLGKNDSFDSFMIAVVLNDMEREALSLAMTRSMSQGNTGKETTVKNQN